MLILTRCVGETIVIGDDIQVRVLGVKGAQVRIGIEAPHDVPVHREEIYRRLGAEPVPSSPSGPSVHFRHRRRPSVRE